MIRKFLWILFVFQPLLAAPDQTVLDRYVARGLKSNLALQQKEFSLEKSLEVLKEAKGLFFPRVSIEARYSRAGGGRLIIVPVGDLVNPVYKSLNVLFGFHGIDAGLPTDLPNEVFPFLREREQETKIRVIQPLFQPAIYHNYKLQSAFTKVNQVELAVFKRQLVSDIKCAYYDYAKTLGVIEILDNLFLSSPEIFSDRFIKDITQASKKNKKIDRFPYKIFQWRRVVLLPGSHEKEEWNHR